MKKLSVRFLSAVLALLMLVGSFSLGVFADDDTSSSAGSSTDSAATGEEESNVDQNEVKARQYVNTVYEAREEKLYTMTLMQRAYGYELYLDEFSGEVACKNLLTGDIVFTNPYDVGSSPSSRQIKEQLLSQIMLTFSDSTGSKTEFNSFKDAASKGQIRTKNLRNGVRVEYSLGDEEVRYLVPQYIKKERYETLIQPHIEASDNNRAKLQFKAYYVLQNPYDETLSVRAVKEMQLQYPITEKMAIYIFDTQASARELHDIEDYIKKYCPDYTYATLEEDHQITGYVSTQKAPPLFKMALEYYLDEEGLQVRLPANGIRFDEDEYTLHSIKILPYFGAGANPNEGYTFIPDGSGALFSFSELAGTAVNITGKVYGTDYAYHEIGTTKSETVRLPVYGVVENYVGSKASLYRYWVEASGVDEDGNALESHWEIGSEYTDVEEDRGFFAIIEEGDALASITTTHGGAQHKYNSVYTEFRPRPSDSYNLSASISIADDTVWTIVSDRKYSGSYKIRIVMLTDKDNAESLGLTEDQYYECSYVGMAKAYRDYLENKGTITRKENSGENIPLYIESFGALDTASTFLSFPTTVRTALTTFDNVKTMYDDLAAEGITNINFRLTGFANGGMHSSVPNGVDFEKSVGGNKGYEELLDYAEEKDFGVFPDFDFSYATSDAAFDGFSYKKDATRTIDNRYSQKRLYYSSYQETLTTGQICISPSVFSKFYGNVSEDLTKMGTTNISVSTLGSDLNSDFDEDEPYNREDSKELVTNLLAAMSEDYAEIMLDAGNAYTWQYADHILNVNLDSSHYNYASHSVPFIGMVLHGYVNFSGSPTNMASDTQYETLKMIENGALPYFTLSYDNTALLKEDNALSKYYSVAYQIWKDDLVDTYNNLNDLLGGVQDATIVNHEFLDGERIPDEDELQADAEAKAEAEAEAKALADKAAERLERARKLAARKGGQVIVEEEEEPDSTLEDLEEFLGDDDEEPKDTEDEKSEGEGTEGEEEIEAVEGVTSKKEDQGNVSKYAVESGSIVRVTYSNGVSYIINYNRFAVTVEGYEIEGLGFVEINA
ncbi:MAG: hypothetical protein IJC50_09585 [Clostridia bacterium]|nr:hypothetical protein [Clostridia bacterium]